MTDFPPTPEQVTIVEAATGSTDNLIIKALAGATKTSTLVRIAKALKSTSILCLAFNKKIAVEMQERLPPNCTAMTLNGLGHRTWAASIGKRLVLDDKKVFTLLKQEMEGLHPKDKEDEYERFADTLKAIEFGKTCGYIPTGHFKNGRRLMDDSEFFAHLDEEPTMLQEQMIRNVTVNSIEQALNGKIDFNDQIFMPTLFPAMFDAYPLVMVDEAQDLSALNHATLRKLAKKRLIAVGDECQAIYGFRGAHEDSMNLLQESFNMKPLILSVSMRCPQAVVREAQWRAPHMKFPEWAKPGEVRKVGEWDQSLIPDHAAIICRNNAPLFGMAIKLLKNGRYPQIVGNDIGKYLVKVMTKFGKPVMARDEVLKAIDEWEAAKIKKARNPTKVYDQSACLRIFADQGENLAGAIAYAEHIFASNGPIQLMTGHKSKGLEFNEVFFLDEDLIGDEPQELNLRYVIQTRAKERLTYIYSRDFFDGDE